MSNLATTTVYATPKTIETGHCAIILSKEPVREVRGYYAAPGETTVGAADLVRYVPDPGGELLVVDGRLTYLLALVEDPRLDVLARILTSGTPVELDGLCEQVFEGDWATVNLIPADALTPLN